jgi:hypothetical protein
MREHAHRQHATHTIGCGRLEKLITHHPLPLLDASHFQLPSLSLSVHRAHEEYDYSAYTKSTTDGMVK